MTKVEINKMKECLDNLMAIETRSLSAWANDIGMGYHTLWRFLYDDTRRTNTRTAFLIKKYLDKRNLLN